MLDALGQLLLVWNLPVAEASEVVVELLEEAPPRAPVLHREGPSSRALDPQADLSEGADELGSGLLDLPLEASDALEAAAGSVDDEEGRHGDSDVELVYGLVLLEQAALLDHSPLDEEDDA
eukprot:113724-Hanusia_phi.AAC.1